MSMINTIYNQIQEKESVTFDELFQTNSATIPTKPELGAFLRTLENEKKIFQYGGAYYDLNKFEDVKGYAQWNLTGFCWLSDTNDMNQWGLTFNPNDNLLSIYNKRDALYGHYIQGKKIILDEKEFVFVTSSIPTQDVSIIATYQQSRNEWVVINSGTNFTFKNTFENIENGVVGKFNFSIESQSYILNEMIGTMQDFGIESKIITLLANITPAPHSEFTNHVSNDLKVLNKTFYTIDSLYTKDIDDAIWIEKNDVGYHLWVAIADVSSYVHPNDIQDKHAQQACSSFYLPHDTVHMLDRQLAENYCSLNAGIEKQAMVCEMQFDNDGVLLNKEFYQAQILSHARLTYDDVDSMLQGVDPKESMILKNNQLEKMTSIHDNAAIVTSLQYLLQFSKTQERLDERAYWVVEQPEYHLGSNGKIDYLYEKNESAPSQKMVESAMLATNICAAQFLSEQYPQFGMFRNQFEPVADAFPKPAFYDVNNEGHWGLKTKFYTHFTSPIRRYCDLLVHRLIKNVIVKDEPLYTNEQLKIMAEQINLQQYKSKQFNIKSKNLLMPQYVAQLLNTQSFDEKLTIVDFSENGIVAKNNQLIDIFIPLFKLERDILKSLEKHLPPKDTVLTNETKRNSIEQLNNDWLLYTKITNFVWTDERKNSYYQISRKQRHYKNKF